MSRITLPRIPCTTLRVDISYAVDIPKTICKLSSFKILLTDQCLFPYSYSVWIGFELASAVSRAKDKAYSVQSFYVLYKSRRLGGVVCH